MNTPSNRIRNLLRDSALALSLGGAVIGAQAADTGADLKFVQQAAAGGMAEVEAGTLAREKGSSKKVKEFGAHMVTDHAKANDELKSIATSKGMALPLAPDAAHQQAKAKLQAASGPDFDRAYKAQMVEDHRKTIALFEQQSKNGQDPQLKAFAAKKLPALHEHLKMAQAL